MISCSKSISTTEPITASTGRIIIDSNPQGAQIFLNSENTGKVTPDSIIDLAAGNYEIILRMDLFLDTTITVTLTNNQRQVIFIDYSADPRNFGTIDCSSEPASALIFLNDTNTSLTTPHTFQFLQPGSYEVKFTYPEHRTDSTNFTLRGNQIKTIFITLQDTSIWVDYNSRNSDYPGGFHACCVAVDNNNIKWIGTRDQGLIRYDEKEWTRFYTHNSPIPSNWIPRIKVDDQNRKWICTTGGLAIYDDNTWVTYTTSNSSIPCNEINAIAFDNQQNVWIGSEARHMLFKFDGSNWTTYADIYMLGYFESEVYSLEIDHLNRIWIGTLAGLIIFDGTSWSNFGYELSEFNINYITSILRDNNNFIWLGAIGTTVGYLTEGGLFYYDGIGFNEVDIPVKSVTDINIDRGENKWVSCGTTSVNANSGGLIKVTPQNEATLVLPNSPILTERRFLGVACDINSNVWIATRTAGIIKLKAWKL
ncbi:MAG: hypothetical protein A2V66_10110 [Ignavibacteria bacterium RBG_13_36_8]|nr:MAG: hypothetical protein A2V66_10110 [Ignavibacteria bacterium RBG_13_36_8]